MIVGSNHQHSTGETVLSHKIYLHRCNMNNQIYYTVYKTTNLINGKIYIGCHQTEDPYDDYLGSGKIIKESIHKHGADSFTKEVLYIFDNADDMYAKEAELVDKDFIQETDNYNLVEGGIGANSECMKNWWKDEEYRKRIIEANTQAQNTPEVKKRKSENLKRLWEDPERRKERSEFMKSCWQDEDYRQTQLQNIEDNLQDPEVKKKRVEKFKETAKNPEYRERQSKIQKDVWKDPNHRKKQSESRKGKIWIYSIEEDIERKISKYESIPLGWIRGRKPKR